MNKVENDYFGFDNQEELPEELDYEHLKPCPNCNKPIPVDSIRCLYCGQEAVAPGRYRWIIITAVIILIIFIFFILF